MDDGPARVLVVEDDEATRSFVALALPDEGHAVRRAGDAASGLAILLDVELPEPAGWAFRRAQRALPNG
jgi:DNA-binding response OmpR family regulator